MNSIEKHNRNAKRAFTNMVRGFLLTCLLLNQFKLKASGSLYFYGNTNSYMEWFNPFVSDDGEVQQYTLEFWLRPESNAPQTIFAYSGHGYGYGAPNYHYGNYSISTLSDGSINVSYSGTDEELSSYNFGINSGPNTLTAGQWTHFAITRQYYTTNVLYNYIVACLYINGSLVSSAVEWSSEGDDPYPIVWGNDNAPVLGQGYTGAIGQFRVWNSALSQTNIQEEINNVFNPQPGPVGDWRFTEGAGDIVYDYAGTNNGIIYGASWSADLPSQPFELPVITLQPTNQTIYDKTTNVVLSVVASGSQPLFYQWIQNGTNILPATTSSTLTIAKATTNDLGVWSVAVTNIAGSIRSSNAVLTMYPFLASTFTGATVLWGQNANVSIIPAGTGPFIYQWCFNGVPIASATNQSFTIAAIQFTNAGFYSVVVTSPFGSITNTPAQIVVNPDVVSLGMYPGLSISGTVGYTYTIQSTPNLADTNAWITVTNLTLQQAQQLWFDSRVNASDPSNPHYFYRVLPQQ